MFSNGSHAQIKKSLESIGTSVAIFERNANRSFKLVSANSLFAEISDRDISKITENVIEEIFPRYIECDIKKSLTDCIEKQASLESELIVDRNGATRWWRCIYSPIYTNLENTCRAILTCVEITEKKLLEKKLELNRKRFKAVIEAAYDGIVSIDTQQNIQLINQAAKEMFGVTNEKLVGQSIETLIPQRFRGNHGQYVHSFCDSPVMSRPMQERTTVLGLRKDGVEFPAEITIAKIQVGSETEMTAVIRDISERSKLIDELQHAAITDPLTNIYNRRHAERILNREMIRINRFNRLMTVVLFDLDHFKNINDTYGHEKGDKVLMAVVEATQKVVRDIDVFSRWGGEEFLLILPETDIKAAVKLIERLRLRFSKISFDWLDRDTHITASFGLTISNGTDTEFSSILRRADNAMYEAKNKGRDNFQLIESAA